MQENNQEKKGFVWEFKQQIMKAWQPVPSLLLNMVIFFILTIIFIVLGILLVLFTDDIQQIQKQYSQTCSSSSTCSIDINIELDMQEPVLFYYEVDGFYQNSRGYYNSFSLKQLQGNQISASTASSSCKPIVYNKDLFVKKSISGKDLDPDAVANPCGQIAYTLFNDTFRFANSSIVINQTAIAWPSDINEVFKYPENAGDVLWTDTRSEHFMVWMRPSAFPSFRKLYGRINQRLPRGNYSIIIKNNFPIQKFKGNKKLVITETNSFGGKNLFLGIAYLVVGCICFLSMIYFSFRKFQQYRQNND